MFPEVADSSPLLQHLNAEQKAAVTLPTPSTVTAGSSQVVRAGSERRTGAAGTNSAADSRVATVSALSPKRVVTTVTVPSGATAMTG